MPSGLRGVTFAPSPSVPRSLRPLGSRRDAHAHTGAERGVHPSTDGRGVRTVPKGRGVVWAAGPAGTAGFRKLPWARVFQRLAGLYFWWRNHSLLRAQAAPPPALRVAPSVAPVSGVGAVSRGLGVGQALSPRPGELARFLPTASLRSFLRGCLPEREWKWGAGASVLLVGVVLR